MVRTVDQISETLPPQVVIFTGGEATRLGEPLLEAIASVSTRGICTRLVTNAEWATTDELSRDMIHNLRDAGLNELNISFDDFHLEYIDLDNVQRAWRASQGVGFGAVALAVVEGRSSWATQERALLDVTGQVPTFTRGHAMLVSPADDGTRYMVHTSPLSRLGRARSLPESCFQPAPAAVPPVGPCGAMAPGAVITADNHVSQCCGALPDTNLVLRGASLDDLHWRDAVDLLVADPLGIALRELGPHFLALLVEDLGGCPPSVSGFRTMCEYCESVTGDRRSMRLLQSQLDYVTERTRMCLDFRSSLGVEPNCTRVSWDG